METGVLKKKISHSQEVYEKVFYMSNLLFVKKKTYQFINYIMLLIIIFATNTIHEGSRSRTIKQLFKISHCI